MAGFASGAIFTNHWRETNGSSVARQREQCPTLCVCGSIFTSNPRACRSATTRFLASYLSNPAYAPARSFIVPSSFITRIVSKLCRSPTSKSFGSCAGVIFTAPVPNSLSTYSSATTGISLSVKGSRSSLPTKCAYRLSAGFTATAVSPSIVSGRVVAIVINSSDPSIGYLKCQKEPASSEYSTSTSESAVLHPGHQLIMRFPR